MRIVDRELPVTAPPGSVGYRYRLADGFVRFWFRFVRPYQDQFETGMSAEDLWEAEVAPGLADHVAPAFERLCQRGGAGEPGPRGESRGLLLGTIATVLFSRSGFTKGLRDVAGKRDDLRLVELDELVPFR